MNENPKIMNDSGIGGALGILKRIIGSNILAKDIEKQIRLKGRNHPDVNELLDQQDKLNEAASRSHKANEN